MFTVAALTISLSLAPGCKKNAESETPESSESAAGPTGDGASEGPVSPGASAPAGAESGATQSASDPGTVRHPGVAIEMVIPPSWNQEREGDALMIQSPDETVLMVFTAVEASDLKAALDVLDQQLAQTITEPELNGFTEGTVNGMSAVMADGVGKLDGVEIELGIALLLAPDGNVMISLGLAQRNVSQETGEQLVGILRSMRPAS